MNVLITLGYCIAAFMLLNHGTLAHHCGAHRAVNALLGLSISLFGMMRASLLLGLSYRQVSWMTDLGHICFFSFIALYLWKGEWPCKLRNWKRQ